MPVHNADIAEIFNELADLLEIQEANPFRVRAYRTAAQTVAGLPRDAADMLCDDEELTELPGIGKDLAGKIEQICEKGTLDSLEQARHDVPGQLPEMMKLPGLGAKRVKLIHDKLGIEDLEGLAEAVESHQLRDIRGFGAKTEEKILEAIDERRHREVRYKPADVRISAAAAKLSCWPRWQRTGDCCTPRPTQPHERCRFRWPLGVSSVRQTSERARWPCTGSEIDSSVCPASCSSWVSTARSSSETMPTSREDVQQYAQATRWVDESCEH